MNKVSEFYSKVLADDKIKAKVDKILGMKDISDATDDELKKIGEIAKELGYDLTIDEARKFIRETEVILSDDALDQVAGGTNKGTVECEGQKAGTKETIKADT